MTKLLSRIGILFTVIVATGFSAAFGAEQGDLAVTIQAADNGVEFTLTNNSENSISLLRWETPFEGELTQDVFAVSAADGKNKSLHSERAMFSGRLIRRKNPGPADFIKIAAGESRSATVPLAHYYQLSDQGMHYVNFRGVFSFREPGKDRTALALEPALKTVFAKTGSVETNLTPVPEVQFARAAGYSSCSAQQLQDLPGDFDASELITREAREALQSLPQNERAGSPRYLQWFGSYNSANYSEALDTYAKSEELMASGEVEFLCDCDEPFYAFIRRTQPFKVNLCTFYWSAPRNGTDSRAGTILHELSHFNEAGGTEDHAYGAALASSLARNDPSRAVNNADSIEYFAENTPFREISAGVALPVQVVAATVYSSLQVDAEVSGSVATDESNFYRVSGADNIVLTSTSGGDPDLYVYADEARSRLLCSSERTGGIDACAPQTFSAAYVQVYGYTAASYTLIAESGAVPLQPGETQTVSIAANDQRFFTVSDADYVQIDSISGDADLYVYSDASRTGESLICDSRNRSDDTSLDTCELNGAGFVSVVAVRAAQFTITSSTENPATAVVATQSGPADIAVDDVLFTTGIGGGVFGPLPTALLLLPALLRRRLAGRRPLRRCPAHSGNGISQ